MRLFGKRHLSITLWLILYWVAALYFLIIIRFTGHSSVVTNPVDPNIPIDYSMFFRMGFVGAVLVGFSFGLLEILFEKRSFKSMSYGKLILIKSLIYVLVFVGAMIFLSIRNFQIHFRAFDFQQWWKVFFDANLLVPLFYMAVVSVLLSFIKQVSLKFGPGNLWKMLIGKFHRPQEEERIFMFLDLKSSTTIAEQLGHIKFSRLLQDCFNDLSVVVDYKAEIYQYVGDEAVLSWNVKEGLKDFNCLMAFFKFDEQLQQRAGHYQSNYGLQPIFKAGLNIGKVTLAEVGEIKREIAFHGDTLNTASRIQDKCNDFGKRLLISEFLDAKLELGNSFSRQLMGQVSLRGKQSEVNIYSVEKE